MACVCILVAKPGSGTKITVRLLSAGDELAIGFTLDFNPAELRFLGATSASANVALYLNPTNALNGHVAVLALNYPSYSPPAMDFAKVTFQPVDWNATNTTMTFSDAMTKREVCNTNADPLVVTFEPATFEIVTRPPQLLALGADGLNFDYKFIGELVAHYLVESSTNLANWSPILNFTNNAITNQFSDSISPETAQKFYRAVMFP